MSQVFNKHITTIDNVKKDSRVMSMHVDDDRIRVCIEEAEEIDIKNAIGNNLYIDLLKYINREDDSTNEVYENLLNGCIYKIKDDNYIFSGLIKSLNYFAYARLVKFGDATMTRIGLSNYESQYSSLADIKRKQEEYKDAYSIAEGLMNECLQYIKYNIERPPCGEIEGIIPKRGTVISAIGD